MSLEELLNNNNNLEIYLDQYGTNSAFLMHFFMQDTTRIKKYFDKYYMHLSFNDKKELLLYLINTNLDNEAISIVFNNLMIFSTEEEKEELNEISLLILEKEKNKELKTSDFHTIVYNYINRSDPIYFIKKDVNNVTKVGKIKDRAILMQIIRYCISLRYTFTMDSYFFLEDNNIIDDIELLAFFINNCTYDDLLLHKINSNISRIEDKKVLNEICNRVVKKEVLDPILSRINIDNYDTSTISPCERIYLKVDDNHEKVLEFLKKMKEEDRVQEVVLIMKRVDMDFIEKTREIYGDKIRISPLERQIQKDTFNIWNYPDYDYEYIKRCEETLDMYASMVKDTVDKDGELKSLSPLEKFVAAYMIVIKFRIYQEANGLNGNMSRGVYDIVGDPENKSIVCLGYVNLLMEILRRMGMEDVAEWSIYAPGEKGAVDERGTNHARMMIHLVDPKYDIDGVYMSDPTWDSRELKDTQCKHMLMAEDELCEIDPELNPKYLRLNNIESVADELHEECVGLLFHNKIPKETIVKAFLAVNRFLDKNMKMAKKDSDYSKLEYDEMAKKIGIEKYPEPTREQLEEMTGEDMLYSMDIYGLTLTVELRLLFKDWIKENGIDYNVGLSSKGVFFDIDPDAPYVEELAKHGYIVEKEAKRVYLYHYEIDNTYCTKPLKEFLSYILDVIKECKDLIDRFDKGLDVKEVNK